jgi:hypothetical protein
LNKYLAVLVLLLAAYFILPSAALSESDEAVVELVLLGVLNDTGNFSYVNADVDSDNNVYIWYIPKNTSDEATMSALGLVIGAYAGMCESQPELSDLSIMIGTEDDVTSEMYCERSWITTGEMSDGDAALLALKVMGTLESAS